MQGSSRDGSRNPSKTSSSNGVGGGVGRKDRGGVGSGVADVGVGVGGRRGVGGDGVGSSWGQSIFLKLLPTGWFVKVAKCGELSSLSGLNIS